MFHPWIHQNWRCGVFLSWGTELKHELWFAVVLVSVNWNNKDIDWNSILKRVAANEHQLPAGHVVSRVNSTSKILGKFHKTMFFSFWTAKPCLLGARLSHKTTMEGNFIRNHNFWGKLFQRTQISQISKFETVSDNPGPQVGVIWQMKWFFPVFCSPNMN
jgi:hypothetical protein